MPFVNDITKIPGTLSDRKLYYAAKILEDAVSYALLNEPRIIVAHDA